MNKQHLISIFQSSYPVDQKLVDSTTQKIVNTQTKSASSSSSAKMTAPEENKPASNGAPQGEGKKKKEKKPEKKKLIDLAPPSGTRDFFPDTMKEREW